MKEFLLVAIGLIFPALLYFKVSPKQLQQTIKKGLLYPITYSFKGTVIQTTPSALFDGFTSIYNVVLTIVLLVFDIFYFLSFIQEGFVISGAIFFIGFGCFALSCLFWNTSNNNSLKIGVTLNIIAFITLLIAKALMFFQI
tara:strand:- start:2506 stop:2928 length:423 start_codon:yes stop_codon:yes gene_type:complete